MIMLRFTCIMLRFRCGERKICKTIENILNIIVDTINTVLKSEKYLSIPEVLAYFWLGVSAHFGPINQKNFELYKVFMYNFLCKPF